MSLRSIPLRPRAIAAILMALLLSSMCFRAIPELPERNTIGRLHQISLRREMLTHMPTDEVVAVCHTADYGWLAPLEDGEPRYMDREAAQREVSEAQAVVERMCGADPTRVFSTTYNACRSRYGLEWFDRANTMSGIADLEHDIASARARTIGYGTGGWLLGLLAVVLTVSLARRGAPPITVDVTRGEAPAEVAWRYGADATLWALAAAAGVLMLLYWSQSFVGWMDLLSDRGPSYRELSERLDVSGLGVRFWATVVPVHAFVVAPLVQLVFALRRELAAFRETEPEIGVPVLVRRWVADEGGRRASAQHRLREKYALAQALQANNGSPADLARTVEEIRALEAQMNQPIPPVDQWLRELLAALASKRAEIAVLRRNGAPDAAVAAAGATVVELRGRLGELGDRVSRGL